MKRIFCILLGHIPININRKEFTAICYRCGKKLEVSYDMTYGETVVIGEI